MTLLLSAVTCRVAVVRWWSASPTGTAIGLQGMAVSCAGGSVG